MKSDLVKKADQHIYQIKGRANSGEERFYNRWGIEIPGAFQNDITGPIHFHSQKLY